MASRRPTMRFTSVDLPTLGRPTTATMGLLMIASSAPHGPAGRSLRSYQRDFLREGGAQGVAVRGDDLDGAGQVGGRGAVEERPVRQADVREEVPVALRLAGQ